MLGKPMTSSTAIFIRSWTHSCLLDVRTSASSPRLKMIVVAQSGDKNCSHPKATYNYINLSAWALRCFVYFISMYSR